MYIMYIHRHTTTHLIAVHGIVLAYDHTSTLLMHPPLKLRNLRFSLLYSAEKICRNGEEKNDRE